ncbi:MAG: 50S ribosomal protein L18e [Candidatus Heimdallarchaeum aukensis]|uniref:Large ribosomal subunit protein eL18 n=1 Tax=Candidatus Heimdallarchaeum aukensis TaxID=2876573 RepID=A0A9Y1BJ48_9ARCH|nr:MAG: 50S ribosomal protein L18e [Candidatus Heimdallarchaeum aukensis]
MPKRTGPTDTNLIEVINLLKKLSSEHKVQIWKTVAEKLEKPRRQRAAVNLSKINRYVSKDEIAVVPGSVLSSGVLDHPVTIAALRFSENAKAKIADSNSKMMTLTELIKNPPEPKKVKIIV